MGKYTWDLEKIKDAVKESINFTEVLDKIGIPRQGNNSKTLRNILDTNNIDYTHFTGRARIYTTSYIEASEYLNGNKKIKSAKLKEKLLKENILENKCSVCGIDSWLGKNITLQLHHIDGNPNNNSLDNLQLLCPNCHSQTENYCGNANSNKTKYYCKECGREITKQATYCPVCAAKHSRKVPRPELEQLIEDFKELKSYTKIGEKYGVKDNTIRKWFIAYGFTGSVKDVKEHINKI